MKKAWVPERTCTTKMHREKMRPIGLHISNRSKVRKIRVTTITDRQQTNTRHREEETQITDSQYHHSNEATCFLFLRKMKLERTRKTFHKMDPTQKPHTHNGNNSKTINKHTQNNRIGQQPRPSAGWRWGEGGC